MKETRRNFIQQAGKGLLGVALTGSFGFSESNQENFHKNIEYEFESSNGAEAHKSGNEFAKRVGDILKLQYPSRVENPVVIIEVTEELGVVKFKFTWRCNFVKSKKEEADYYFDRRGTLSFGETPQIAHNNVEAELKQSGKVQQMMDAFDLQYGNHKMPNSFVSESISQPVEGRVWCVREFFCTAKKNN